MRLTDLAIRKLPLPGRGQKTYFDDQLGGFGIRCSQKSKSFIVMYGKNRRLKTLGRYPSKSLKDARKEAMRYLGRGSAQNASMSFTDARTAFLEECEEKNRLNTVREYRRYLSAFTGTQQVRDITRQNLKPHLTGPHATTAFKVFFNWCVRNELADRNPLAAERAIYGPSKNRVLTADELKAVWGYDDKPFSDIVKLLILLGQRRTETSLIEPGWIEGNLITFPTDVTKNKKEHTIPFGELAAPLLPPIPFAGWSKAKARMDEKVAIAPWTLHDLRRTFSTIHAQIGTPIHVTERLLNHTSGTISGVAGIYNRHTYMPEMERAVLNYEEHLKSLLQL